MIECKTGEIDDDSRKEKKEEEREQTNDLTSSHLR